MFNQIEGQRCIWPSYLPSTVIDPQHTVSVAQHPADIFNCAIFKALKTRIKRFSYSYVRCLKCFQLCGLFFYLIVCNSCSILPLYDVPGTADGKY